MITTHRFSVLKSTWGISVTLAAEIVEGKNEPVAAEPVPWFWVAVRTTGLAHEDIEATAIGVRLFVALGGVLPPGQTLVIHRAEFAITDYQVEGMSVAVAGWLAKSLQQAVPEVQVHYDPKGRYVFDHPLLRRA